MKDAVVNETEEFAVVPHDVSDDGIARFVCPKCGKTTYEWKPPKCAHCNIKFRYPD